jgi:PAS domain S-box-containing protein
LQTIHHILLAISAIIGILAFYTISHRKTEFGITYFLLLVAILIYSFGYAFEIESSTIQDIYFWLRIQYLGIAWLPTIFLILAIQYTGNKKILKQWFVGSLITISIVTLTLQYTNWNNLFYTSFHINTNSPFPVANFHKGSWYWVHQIYSNISFLISSIVYFNMMLTTAGINKIRSGIMFFTAIIPWVFYIIYLLGFSPYNIDLNPFSVAIVGILGALGIFKFQLLEFEPLALDSIFKTMSEGVLILDNQKKLLLFNHQAEKIFPKINNILIGTNVIPILTEYLNFDELFNKYPENEPFELEIDNQGIVRYYQVKWSEIKENEGKKAGNTIIITDITKRKEIEKQLLENARELEELNQNRTRFLAILGHDLRNPLNVILNFSEILLYEIEGKVSDSTKEIAQTIYDTTFTTCFLTENLLKWSQLLREGMIFNPQETKLDSILKEEIRLAEPQTIRKNIIIKTDIQEDIKIIIDSNMIRTVFRNLLTNAIKFSYKNDEIIIKTYKNDHEAIIEITDYGIGINETEQKKLFQIEQLMIKKGTASEIGSGLGLIICKEFITKHNGNIGVRSNQSQGSTFWFTLPC